MAETASPTTKPASEGIVIKDTYHAPVVYFDGAPNFGNNSGIINIPLVMGRHLAAGDHLESDIVVVAHLRCSIAAAIDLRNALNSALLLGAPTEGKMN